MNPDFDSECLSMDVCLTCYCRLITYTAVIILIMQLKCNIIGDEIKRKQSKRRHNVQQTSTSSSLVCVLFGSIGSLFRLNSSLDRSWALLFRLSFGTSMFKPILELSSMQITWPYHQRPSRNFSTMDAIANCVAWDNHSTFGWTSCSRSASLWNARMFDEYWQRYREILIYLPHFKNNSAQRKSSSGARYCGSEYQMSLCYTFSNPFSTSRNPM